MRKRERGLNNIEGSIWRGKEAGAGGGECLEDFV